MDWRHGCKGRNQTVQRWQYWRDRETVMGRIRTKVYRANLKVKSVINIVEEEQLICFGYIKCISENVFTRRSIINKQ